MLKSLASTYVLSCALLLPAYAAPTNPVAIVNGVPITQQSYDDYIKARAKQTGTNVTPDGQALINELIHRELLRQDALRKKLDKTPEFVDKINYLRDNLLMAIGMQDYLDKHPIDDKTLRKIYDYSVTTLPKEYLVRHILVETEKSAKAIIAELEEGKAFAKLAKENSIDPGSAKKNGELGWITKQKVVPSFGDAVEKLEKGKYTSSPVKSDYGWHVIQVDDVRSVTPPSFDSVKENIRTSLQNQHMQQYLGDLISKAKIKFLK